jgi:hypothetical protein
MAGRRHQLDTIVVRPVPEPEEDEAVEE